MLPPFRLLRMVRFTVIAATAILIFVFGAWFFTTTRLNAARSLGIFPSPAEGMLALIQPGYTQIIEARIMTVMQETAPGGGPHVWFVTACVWADSRVDGSKVGSARYDFDFPGSYFVNTPEGWVLMPETSMPLFVGFWMDVFDLAGDHTAQPYRDPAAGQSRSVCPHPAE
jgi:hypothetical protein